MPRTSSAVRWGAGFRSGRFAIIANSTGNAAVRQQGEQPVARPPLPPHESTEVIMAEPTGFGSESSQYPQGPAALFPAPAGKEVRGLAKGCWTHNFQV
jgi:hypothetical protein